MEFRYSALRFGSQRQCNNRQTAERRGPRNDQIQIANTTNGVDKF